jgi:hypothetical protein
LRFFGLPVAVEDNPEVLLQSLDGSVLGLGASLNLGRHLREGIGGDGVEDGVDERRVLGRADGAELEPVQTPTIFNTFSCWLSTVVV